MFPIYVTITYVARLALKSFLKKKDFAASKKSLFVIAPDAILRDLSLIHIFPVYNVEDYLEKSLSSLLIQTYRKLQVIIIDDGSTEDVYKRQCQGCRAVYCKD